MAELKEFLNGREIWGVFYFPSIRAVERLKLIREMKTVYKCEYEVFRFATSTNELLGHEKKIISIKKNKLIDNLWIYGYSLDEAVQNSIEHQKREIEYLKNKISAMEEEIEKLSKYKEWFPTLS